MTLLVQYTLIYASVLILVALGGCFAEHSGVINLGLEGIMIMGALGGACDGNIFQRNERQGNRLSDKVYSGVGRYR